jgi:predicted ArsR family transcriptional regulator
MAVTILDSRFFESTLGKIVTARRGGGRTVNELAEQLSLSDNAVRAHLLTLERDGLVTPGGTVKGYRKPHFVYVLTEDARHIFPKFYDSLFNRLLDSLKRRLPVSGVIAMLEEVGRNIGTTRAATRSEPLEKRVENALAALQELGGAAVAVAEGEKVLIQSSGCPFADAVSEHPEVCKVAESLVQEIVGEPVREVCDRTSAPRCRFVIEAVG